MTRTGSSEPKFGTSGLRGPAEGLTDELVGRYTRAFVENFPGDGTLWVGRDRRESSPRIADAVRGAAAASGLIVIDAGILPTPALALSAMGRGTVSIMVTGSHIPADRNGLKFYRADGEIDKADETVISTAAADVAPIEPVSQPAARGDAVQTYIARYVDFFGKRSLQGERIGVWQHSSSASETLPALIEALGGEAVPLGPSETFVPIDTEAVDPAMQETFAEWCRGHMLDAVISTDGDADRPLLTDETGRIVPGDVLGAIAAHTLGATHVVTTVSANTLVDHMGVFAEVRRTKIGSPYVIAAMEALKGEKVVGYEPNGGMLLGFELVNGTRRLAPLMTRDCALPLVLALLAGKQNDGIGSVVAALPRRRTASDRLTDVPTEIGQQIVDEVKSGDYSLFPRGFGAPLKVDTVDGVRLTFEGDIVLMIRPSQNAPELRAYVEVANTNAARGILDGLLYSLRRRVDDLTG